MEILLVLFLFILGAIIGSFLNVVILRYNTGAGITGYSGCFTCGEELKWYELFPILSYIFLRARCSKCKSPISLQYPLVEIGTGLLFLGTYIKGFDGLTIVFPLIILSLLVVVFVYDLRHKIIPNGIVYAFIIISFLLLFIDFSAQYFVSVPNVVDFSAGPMLAFPFLLIWLFSKGTWMGLGDSKLVLGIGWYLGMIDGLSAVIFAFWIGAVVTLLILFLQKVIKHISMPFSLSSLFNSITIKSEIPFAPFLIIGFLLVFFTNYNILDLIY